MKTGIEPSVVFRTGPLTDRDYDEAIAFMQEAKQSGLGSCPCGDSGHSAESCHHNPLVQARRGAKKDGEYRCYHCGEVFTEEKAANEHFGFESQNEPACLAVMQRLDQLREEAQRRAIQSLARYKFQMFGYHAAIWVHLNRIAPSKKPNPFRELVEKARSSRVTSH